MSSPVIISGALVGARELLLEEGIDPTPLAQQAGLPPRAFDEPDLFVRAAAVVDFMELAAQACRSEAFGLRHARRLPLGILGQGGMIMRAADSVGAALRDFAQLYGLYTDAGTVRLEPERGGAWVCYDFLPIGRWGVRQIVQLTLGCICLFVAESLGRREWHPTRTVLRELPADPRSYNEFFGHGLRFAQPRDAVFIDRETLDTRRHVSQVRSHVQRSDVSLGQVANLLGYESQAAFSRAFRRWYDMTPRLARRPGAGFAPDPRRRPRIKLGATDE